MNRRELMLGLGAALAACRALRYSPADPRPLDDHELATLAAIAEAFLPGTPGAADVDAVETLIDPAHGLVPYASELVGDLDQWCLASKLKTFVALDPAQRELALEQRMGLRGKAIRSWYAAAYDGALALTKLAFCDHPIGRAYLAFPGASRGYAPGSAAGAYLSRERPFELVAGRRSTIAIAGGGVVSLVRASVLIDGRAAVRIVAPDGRAYDVALTARAVDLPVPLAGAPAAGVWRCEIAGGAGRFDGWMVQLRTDLDDRA